MALFLQQIDMQQNLYIFHPYDTTVVRNRIEFYELVPSCIAL